MKAVRKSSAFVVSLVAVLAVASGCRVTNNSKPAPLFGANEKSPVEQAPASQGMVTVELHPTRGKVTRGQMPCAESMTVQDALEISGANKKFRNLTYEVVRFDQEKGKQIKMGGSYLPEKRTAAAHFDYALRPGDQINVTEDSSSPIDGVLDPISRILGG